MTILDFRRRENINPFYRQLREYLKDFSLLHNSRELTKEELMMKNPMKYALIIGIISGVIIGIIWLTTINIGMLWIGLLIFLILFSIQFYYRLNQFSYASIPSSYEQLQPIHWKEIEDVQKLINNLEFQRIVSTSKDESYQKFCKYLQDTPISQIQTDYIMDVTIRKQINYKIHQRRMLKIITESLFGMI